ncbi:hypothetical protein [Streptomyces inhibens]|uniref:hypothetical protein n=1 Tax=Streptomyces inhibens TaxID=2293571 RepID=UPI001FD36409|nr:hypothetical protein [Streptomyces inhibens]
MRRASLQTDLANAQARNTRLAVRIQQLEKRLSHTLGEHAWRESGLGASADVEGLQHTITRLEQQNTELAGVLEETQSDLEAARAANRDLPRALNQRG